MQNLLQNNHKIDYILCFIRWRLKWNSDNVRETKLCFVWILTGSQVTNHIFERKCRTAVPDWGKRENFFLSRPFINSNPSVRLFLRMATPYIIPPKIVLCDALKVLMIRSRNCVKDMFFACALALALLYRFILKMLIILNLFCKYCIFICLLIFLTFFFRLNAARNTRRRILSHWQTR